MDQTPKESVPFTGEEMAPQRTLDADLAHLADRSPAAVAPVRPRRSRRAHEVPVLYRGRRDGFGDDAPVTVTVPDSDNERRVASLARGIMPTMDLITGQMSAPLDAQAVHTSGITYQFPFHETQLVDAEDVPWLLRHEVLDFVRADAPRESGDDDAGTAHT